MMLNMMLLMRLSGLITPRPSMLTILKTLTHQLSTISSMAEVVSQLQLLSDSDEFVKYTIGF
jgi:hypothetical protein